MASKEDLAFFSSERVRDPENKVCFECSASNPQWCDVWHGIYVCLECSGIHRSFGTHVSFVRSLSMDGWQEDKMKLMKVGGNGKAKAFFRSHGIKDGTPIREKYTHDAVFMYKDKLAAEAAGKVFKESEWVPPPKAQSYVNQYSNARPEPGFGGNRYQGIGANTVQPKSDVIGDAGAILSKGWSSLSAALSDAANVTATKSREFAAGEKMKSVSDMGKSSWGSLAGWAKSMTSTGEDDAFGEVLARADVKRGGYSGISSQQVSGNDFGRQESNVSNRSVTSPSSDGPVFGKSQSDSPSASNEWNWNEEDDGWGNNSMNNSGSSNNSGLGSRKKGLGSGASKGASMTSLRKAPKKGD